MFKNLLTEVISRQNTCYCCKIFKYFKYEPRKIWSTINCMTGSKIINRNVSLTFTSMIMSNPKLVVIKFNTFFNGVNENLDKNFVEQLYKQLF